MAGTDDLAPLLTAQAEGRLVMGQATVKSWDPANNLHTLNFRGSQIENVGVLHGVSSLGYQPGNVVLLLGWIPERGTGSWWILGRALIPGQDSPDLVVRGSNIIVEGGGSVRVEGGGDVEIFGGGRFQALHTDGTVSASLGPVWDPALTMIEEDGLLVQANQSDQNFDILRAFHSRLDGLKSVFVGQTEVATGEAKPVDDFAVRSQLINITTYLDDSTPVGDAQTRISQSVAINLQSKDQINLRTPDAPAVRVDAASTGNSPNAVILSPNGTIAVNTSARRFKSSIEDYQVDTDAVLQLQPRTWRDKRDVELDPDTEAWHVGLVAEEVDALGLHEFVDYDADGDPQRVTYDRLCIALLQIVQSQEERLVALETAAGISAPQQTRQVTRKPKRRPIDDGADNVPEDRVTNRVDR